MSEFQVIEPTSQELYWYELFKYVSPYATVGSFLLNAISLLSADDQQRANERLFQKLEEISVQIRQLRASIEKKLNDITVKERSGEVLGIKEALEEYRRLQSRGILDNVITGSAETKRKIEAYLNDSETPISYYLAYNSLKCTLLPLRVACFFLYNRPKVDTYALVRDELHDLLANKDQGIEISRTIGRNRVSYKETIFLLDELGPVWGTDFSIAVDGRGVYGDMFSPREGGLNEKRQKAKEKYKEIAEIKADEVSQDIRKCYDDAQKSLDQIGA